MTAAVSVSFWLAWFFFAMAIFFVVVGSIGMLTMPDLYTRLQAGGLSGGTAVISVLLGALFWVEPGPFTGRLLVLLVFFLVSSPTAAHIIGRYAWREEQMPWKRPRRWHHKNPGNPGESGKRDD